jgi:hypothetical protein
MRKFTSIIWCAIREWRKNFIKKNTKEKRSKIYETVFNCPRVVLLLHSTSTFGWFVRYERCINEALFGQREWENACKLKFQLKCAHFIHFYFKEKTHHFIHFIKNYKIWRIEESLTIISKIYYSQMKKKYLFFIVQNRMNIKKKKKKKIEKNILACAHSKIWKTYLDLIHIDSVIVLILKWLKGIEMSQVLWNWD